jgi:hypothetical protein
VFNFGRKRDPIAVSSVLAGNVLGSGSNLLTSQQGPPATTLKRTPILGIPYVPLGAGQEARQAWHDTRRTKRTGNPVQQAAANKQAQEALLPNNSLTGVLWRMFGGR